MTLERFVFPGRGDSKEFRVRRKTPAFFFSGRVLIQLEGVKDWGL